MNMWEIDSILKKYKETIDSYDEFKNIRYKNNSWHELRDISIYKLINNEDIDEIWIQKVENTKLELPLEACLLLNMYLDKFNISPVENLYKYNKKIIDILYNKIEFNLPGNILSKIVKKIILDESYRYKKNLLFIKFANLKEINIKDFNRNHAILGLKINNISKIDIINYYQNLKNYIYVANENIEIIDLVTGDILSKYKKDNKIKKCSAYITVSNIFSIQNKRLDIESNFERMLLYETVGEIYSSDILGTLNKDIVNIILDNKDLFEKEYITKILNVIKVKNKNQTVKYIDKLIKNPNNKTLLNIIRESENIEEIFSILKQSEAILEEIRLDIYVEAIYKCNKIAKENENNTGSKINIALFCEELIAEKPIIFTELIDILKEMYKDKLFTNKTVETLKYLKHTVKDERIIDDILLQIKYENCEFDNEYIDKIISIQQNLSEFNIEFIDKMLNKLIYNEDDISKYKNNLFEQIYNFYKRNNDFNALDKLCNFCVEKNKNISSYKITDEDINKLIKFYQNNQKKLDNNYNLKLINEFKYNDKIFEYGKLTVECMYMKQDKDAIDLLNNKYSHLLKAFKKQSDIIYEEYLKMLEYSDSTINLNELINLDEEEIQDINKILMKRTSTQNTKLRMLKILINYYIITNCNKGMLDYMNLYINSYSEDDNGNLFKNILFNHSENLDFIEVVLNDIDFNSIPNAEIFMENISKKLINNLRIDLLPEVIRYYIANEKYENALPILKIYISKTINKGNIVKHINVEIDELKYEMYILPILEYVDENYKKELYSKLIQRDDFPITIRERYFNLLPSDENRMYLVNAFIFNQTDSLLAKEFAIEEYYNNDDKFCKLVNMGNKTSNKIYDLVYEKVKEQFKNNKGYVEELIENIYKEDERLSKIYEYINDYNYNIFDKSSQNVFGNYTCISREKGEYADQLLLQNIFDNSELNPIGFTAIGFTDEDDIVDNCIYNYLNKINADYDQVDDNVIKINETNDLSFFEEDNILNFIENIKLVLILLNNLIRKKRILIEFNKDTFIINKKGFIPNSYKYIYEYTEQFRAKTPSSNGKYKVINEKNICKLTQIYFKNLLLDICKLEHLEKIKNDFILDVLDNDIATYEELIVSIDEFIEKQNKAFENISYKQKLEKFDSLNDLEKTDVIYNILIRKDTSVKAKEIVLKFENHFHETDLYIRYLIDCFNNSNSEFTEEDYLNIYEKVNKNISASIIDDIKNEIFNFYINAKDKCKIYKNDLINDIDNIRLSNDDKEYLISRI